MQEHDFAANRKRLLEGGVLMMDPEAVYVEDTVVVGKGTFLLPGTILRGNTVVGEGCTLGPNTMLTDCTVGNRVSINASQCVESVLHDGAIVGPFAYIRPGCVIGEDVKVGDFVEVKNANVGKGTKLPHLTYVGDADVGEGCNFGCGSITVNYDGKIKHRTTVGDRCFIGCNSNLVAPVTVGDGAYTAAGSTITHEVPKGDLAVARARQVNLTAWADKRRAAGKLK